MLVSRRAMFNIYLLQSEVARLVDPTLALSGAGLAGKRLTFESNGLAVSMFLQPGLMAPSL